MGCARFEAREPPTCTLFPDYADVLERARRWRLGEKAMTFTVEDGRRLADLIDDVIEDVG